MCNKWNDDFYSGLVSPFPDFSNQTQVLGFRQAEMNRQPRPLRETGNNAQQTSYAAPKKTRKAAKVGVGSEGFAVVILCAIVWFFAGCPWAVGCFVACSYICTGDKE